MGLDGAGAGAPPPRRGTPINYRGYRLSQERNLGWTVEPLSARVCNSGNGNGFSTPPSSLADVKALIDWRLDQAA
ncbi:MAG: hypothetical protein ACK5GZ_13365 [Cyanobium sp.]|jgi:hypothetical protein